MDELNEARRTEYNIDRISPQIDATRNVAVRSTVYNRRYNIFCK